MTNASAEHKNKSRAPIKPLDFPTITLTSLGLGFLRPAPGTWGSMPPPALVLVLILLGASPLVLNGAILGLLVVSSIICVAFGGYAERRFGRKDAAEVVIDETAGVCLPLLFWPAALTTLPESPSLVELIPPVVAAGVAFVLFRLADIVKPWPARALEKLPRGWGVLIDDLAAGLYAAIAMHLVIWGWLAIA